MTAGWQGAVPTFRRLVLRRSASSSSNSTRRCRRLLRLEGRAHGQMALPRALLLEPPETVRCGFKSHPQSIRSSARTPSSDPQKFSDTVGAARGQEDQDVERSLVACTHPRRVARHSVLHGKPVTRWRSSTRASRRFANSRITVVSRSLPPRTWPSTFRSGAARPLR